MNAGKNEFDPREALEGLFNYVKDIATTAVKRPASPQPSDTKIDVAVLGALDSGSKTISQIRQSIAISSAGAWSPTDGQVSKSTLQLSETKLVSSKTKGDRKVFSITAEGKSALANASEAMGSSSESAEIGSRANLDWSWMLCDAKFLSAASKLPPVILDLAQTANKEQQARAALVLEKARQELHVILAEK